MTAAMPMGVNAHAEYLCDDTHDEWKALRREGIGASESPAIMNESGWAGPATIAAIKLGLEVERDVQSELLEWGRYQESALVRWFREETNLQAELCGQMWRSREWPFLTATLDAVVWEDNGEAGGGECKNALWSAADWEGTGTVPRKYWIQQQHQMAVFGFRFNYAMVLLGGYRPRWARTERDDEFIEQHLVPACQGFWSDVQEFKMPAPGTEATDAEYKAIQAKFPAHEPGKEISLAGEKFVALAADYRDGAALEKAGKKQKENARNLLAAAMGDAEVAYLDDGTKITFKQQTRDEYVVAANKFRVVRVGKAGA